MSDACGRAFEAIYNDADPQRLGSQYAILWGEVARRFAQHLGVAFYELCPGPPTAVKRP
jgi:hypothetical protein